MANGSAAMKSVIAQLGERQQLTSKITPTASDRPSPVAGGVKPLPSKKPTTAATASALPAGARVAAKPHGMPSTDPDSPVVTTSRRPPITAQKPFSCKRPTSSSRQSTGTTSDDVLKPAKSPVVTSPPSAAEFTGDEASSAPPWQKDFVKRRNGPPPTPAKKQLPPSVANSGGVDVQSSRAAVNSTSSSPDNVKQSAVREDAAGTYPTPAAQANTRSNQVLKDAGGVVQPNARESSSSGSNGSGRGVGGASRRNVAGPDTPTTAGISNEVSSSDDATARSLSPRAPARPADKHVSPSRSQPINAADRGASSTTTKEVAVIGSDGRRYRRLPAPSEATARPPRKPAKPPVVDLSPYLSVRSTAGTVPEDEDEEVYDDAVPADDGQVTLRTSGTAGRQNPAGGSSVVSQIAEYTEEEEMEGWRASRSRGMVHCRPPSAGSQSSDEVYDDVGATESAANMHAADDIYDDDEVYEVLD